jgi:hypothetical protein
LDVQSFPRDPRGTLVESDPAFELLEDSSIRRETIVATRWVNSIPSQPLQQCFRRWVSASDERLMPKRINLRAIRGRTLTRFVVVDDYGDETNLDLLNVHIRHPANLVVRATCGSQGYGACVVLHSPCHTQWSHLPHRE